MVHQGQTIYTRGYGYADRASHRRPDPQTIYRVGCCANAFTATVLCLLEEARRVNFDGAFGDLSESFPEILNHNPNFTDKFVDEVHLEDVLSHRTGLAAVPYAIRGVNGSIFAPHKDILHIFANLPFTGGLGVEFNYSEWSYAVVAYLIDKLSHLPWAEAVDDILGRLGLIRTYTTRIIDDNYARAYIPSGGTRTDQSYQLPLVEVEDEFEWSGSVRTCVTDMLRWCRLLIKASQHVDVNGIGSYSKEIHPVSMYGPETLTRERILRALWTIQQPDTSLDYDSTQMYCKGLYAFTSPIERISLLNKDLDITRLNSMGMRQDSSPKKVIGHTGDLGSFTSTYLVFPETESAVVVLTNANSANGNPSTIVAQVLTEALFELQPALDYRGIAKQLFENAISQWKYTVNEWESHRIPRTTPNHPNAYVGDFTNADLRMTLSFRYKPSSQTHAQENSKMMFRINGIREQTFEVHHYHNNSWTFMPPSRDRNECLRLGLGIYIPCWQSFILDFGPFDSGHCHWVEWRLDPDPRVSAHTFIRVDGRV